MDTEGLNETMSGVYAHELVTFQLLGSTFTTWVLVSTKMRWYVPRHLCSFFTRNRTTACSIGFEDPELMVTSA